MWKLKSCPRCNGDMYEQWLDIAGSPYQCLQCGYIDDHQPIPRIGILKKKKNHKAVGVR